MLIPKCTFSVDYNIVEGIFFAFVHLQLLFNLKHIIFESLKYFLKGVYCILKLKKALPIFLFFTIIFCSISISSIYAASSMSTPSLVTKINNAFTKIQKYLVKISIPICGVCIISGILLRKLCFGDEQKAILGKRMIINSVIGYAAIQSIDVIIKFIDSVIK